MVEQSPFDNLEMKNLFNFTFFFFFSTRHIFPLVWLYRLFRSLATNTIIKREISRHYEYNIQQSIAARAWSNHISGKYVCDCVYPNGWICVCNDFLPFMIYGESRIKILVSGEIFYSRSGMWIFIDLERKSFWDLKVQNLSFFIKLSILNKSF